MTSAEQQAKELSEQLVLNIVLLYNGNYPGAEIIKEANKVVAAALAACAREELQALLDEHESIIEDDLGGWEVVRTEYIRKRIAALERAAGESSLDPQGGRHEN